MRTLKNVLREVWSNLDQGFDLLWGNICSGLPTLIVALILVVLGSLIAVYVGDLITSIIKKGGIDKPLEGALSPISKLLNTKINSAKLIGATIEWLLLITVLIATFNLLKLNAVVSFFIQALSYLPSIFVAVFIMIVGYLIATFTANVVKILTKGEHGYLSNLARITIFTFSAISASSVVLIPLVGAFSRLLRELHFSTMKKEAVFIGVVVLLVFAFKNLVTKTVEKLFES